MPKHNKRITTISDRLAAKCANQVDPERSELLAKILEEGSSIILNGVTKQKSARQALEAHSDLLSSIEQLKKLELKLNPTLPIRDGNSWSRFFNWLDAELGNNNGQKLSDKIAVIRQLDNTNDNNSPSGEFSLITKVPIKEGESILRISRKLMLSTETAANDHDLIEFIKSDSIASSMQNVLLTLHLLNEHSKGEKSYWYPYLSILPRKILPVLLLNRESLNCLLPSAHIFEALKMIRAIARQYSYFFKRLQSTHLPLSKNFTFEYYCWGVSMICSRQNEIPPSNRKTASIPVVHALIPVLDMCNHDRLSNQATFEMNESKLVASKDLQINDEITINYGNRSSGDFFIHNGFVPKEVPHDIVPLEISLDKENALFKTKTELLKILNMPNFGRFRLTRNDSENRHRRDPHLTMFLIVNLLNEDELDFIMDSANPVGIADEIYTYIQYNQQATETTTDDLSNSLDKDEAAMISSMRDRLASSVRNYLSRRASIGLALIDRALKENETTIDKAMLMMLNHEKSIYESYVINNE